jgi:hypothetical protein
VYQNGGIGGLSARLRRLSDDLAGSIADMILAEAEECGRAD